MSLHLGFTTDCSFGSDVVVSISTCLYCRTWVQRFRATELVALGVSSQHQALALSSEATGCIALAEHRIQGLSSV